MASFDVKPSASTSVSMFLCCLWLLLASLTCAEPVLSSFRASEVSEVLNDACFVAVRQEAPVTLLTLLTRLSELFQEERAVVVGRVDLKGFLWPDGKTLRIKGFSCTDADFLTRSATSCSDNSFPDVVYIPKIVTDKTCLMTPPHLMPEAEAYTGPKSLDSLVDFINVKCGTFRTASGTLSSPGLHREEILRNVFRVSSISDVTMGKLSQIPSPFLSSSYRVTDPTIATDEKHKENCNDSQNSFIIDSCSAETCENNQNLQDELNDDLIKIPLCSVISMPLSRESFFDDYLTQSKPVIIKGALNEWPALSKWTHNYFNDTFGDRRVHVKMTPGGDFEGVEKAEKWEDFGTFKIPEEVSSKLPYPDLVVVRPAGVSMNFSEFLDLITWAAEQSSRNVSAYLEYSSIRDYFPELLADLDEFDFVKELLQLRHLNMWLSDGNTLGRLHFDPFDNFLCQLRGKKQVTLFEPFDNEKLYEAHIPQATLGYMRYNHTFRRRKLEDSTSMVMSPVDLLNPDFQRFPKFASAQPMNCTIEEGDVLFMPAFWWHEVYSWPNVSEKRNLAVNFWYEPFLHKEFPCPECKMDVNPTYYNML